LAEHWLYLSLIGFSLVFISQWFSFDSPTGLFAKLKEPALLIVLLVYAVTTYHSGAVWRDDISLYKNILKYTNWQPETHKNLGLAYLRKGMSQEAEEQFKMEEENAQFGQ
jgi:hypothetical protein